MDNSFGDGTAGDAGGGLEGARGDGPGEDRTRFTPRSRRKKPSLLVSSTANLKKGGENDGNKTGRY